MKKILGLTIGGLNHKILQLVLIDMLIIVAIFIGMMYYKDRSLTNVVEVTRTEQQDAIRTISEDTLNLVIEGSMVKTNALQSHIADTMFSSIKKDVLTLQTLAEEMFRNRDIIVPGEVSLPDPANDGKVTAQVLYAEGVDYKASVYLPTASRMTDTMAAMYRASEYKTNVYIGFEDGTHISVDSTSSDKFDENGKLITFPVCDRPWYTKAAETGDVCFTSVISDMYTGTECVSCSAPVYMDGKLIGVVGIDIFLDAVNEYVKSSLSNGSFICIIDGNGKVIFAPDDNGIFTVDVSENAADLRKSENKELADFVTDALREKTGLRTVNIGGSEYYLAATPLSSVDWTVVSVVIKEVTRIPTAQLLDEYDRINEKATAAFRDGTAEAAQAMLIITVCVFVISITGVVHFAGKIVKPIESMTAEIIEGSRTGKLFEMKDEYNTGDEIEVLARSFDDLSKKTRQYIIDITEITKEKERIGTELGLARKIQADMLPNIYPAFPNRPEIDIYATMTPAKEVGGDFYDFFLIDDDHLGMVMADVSGKGVPAALFMMMSKILINNYAMQGGSPAQVLAQTNNAICKKNDEEMFVTVWFGVLEISTGKITAANAGHEFPVIRKANGDYELYEDRHGFVIGGLANTKYKEYEIYLEKGGALFLYTDGVPEATNTQDEQFGTDRLIEALNAHKELGPRQLLPELKVAIDEFVGDGEQFDDLTMLALTLI